VNIQVFYVEMSKFLTFFYSSALQHLQLT